MSRQRRQSGTEDILDLVSALPWQIGLLLAPVSFLVAHHFASTPVPTGAQPADLGNVAISVAVRTVTGILQYVLPVLCVIAAGVSAVKQRRRTALASIVAEVGQVTALGALSWVDFERLVGEAFRMRGYRVIETGGGGADGGADLVLSKDGETFLVQCKHWRALKVGIEVVRELYGVMAAQGAVGGFVVTSDRFSDAAKEFASGRHVTLVEGPQLVDMIARAKRAGGDRPGVSQSPAPAPAPAPEAKSDAAPLCPNCQAPTIKRTAKRGARAGSQFWACTRYPKCMGTVDIG